MCAAKQEEEKLQLLFPLTTTINTFQVDVVGHVRVYVTIYIDVVILVIRDVSRRAAQRGLLHAGGLRGRGLGPHRQLPSLVRFHVLGQVV